VSATTTGGATTVLAGQGSGASPDTIRRVAFRLMPFLLVCYFISFLDRINVAFAALQMNKAIGLTTAQYGFGAGLFFLTYCLFEVPSNLMLVRVGATRWIARIMLVWGLCAAGMAFVVGPHSFFAMRLLLGAAEAGFFPGVLFFLTLWFPTAHRGRVVSVFMAGVAISGLLGAPISGLLLSLDGFLGLQGWQWLFIIEGVPAILLAPVCLYYLQDGPAHAPWLAAPEREALTETLNAERRERELLRRYSVFQALTNPRVLFLAAVYFTNVCLLNSVLFFLPLILKGFGLSNIQSGFVAAIPSLAALVAVIWWGRRSDRRMERAGHAAFANLLAGAALLGAALLVNPTAQILAVTVAFAATLAFTPPFWSIPAAFLSGAASAGGMAAISSLGVIGGFVAPSIIGYLRDLTGDFRYGLGAFGLLAMVLAVALYFVGSRWEIVSSGPSQPLEIDPGVRRSRR
jgi:ACS family tartrate transporter-like MFS transporter